MIERSRRGVPIYAWVALGGAVALHLVWMVAVVRHDHEAAMMEASRASSLTAGIAVAIAMSHLRRSVSGSAAHATTIAMWSYATVVAIEVIESVFLNGGSHDDLWRALSYVTWAGEVAAAVALVVAAKRVRVLAIVGGLLVFADKLPPAVWDYLWSSGIDMDLAIAVLDLLSAIGWIGTLLLLVGAVHGPRTADPALARKGLQLAARGVWLRVFGLCASVVVGFVLAHRGGFALPSALFAAVAVGLIASLLFGIGLLQASDSGIDGLPLGLLDIAGTLSLWCGGVTLVKLPYLYGQLIERQDFVDELVSALALAEPIIAVLATGLFATAVSGLAHQHGNRALATRMRNAGIAIVVLPLAALLIDRMSGTFSKFDRWMFPLAAAACTVIGQIVLGQLCGTAVTCVDEHPAIPTAKIVK